MNYLNWCLSDYKCGFFEERYVYSDFLRFIVMNLLFDVYILNSLRDVKLICLV